MGHQDIFSLLIQEVNRGDSGTVILGKFGFGGGIQGGIAEVTISNEAGIGSRLAVEGVFHKLIHGYEHQTALNGVGQIF